MVSKELIGFMRRNFGDRCLRVLNEAHHKVGVEDIEAAKIEDRKNFIIEMQPFLRESGVAKSEILITELMNILNVNIYETGGRQLGINKSDRLMIKEYIDRSGEWKIRSGLEEMNTLINLYMENTQKALKKGVSKATIEKNTEKVLMGLKNSMISIGKDIEQRFNVNINIPFIQKRIQDIEERGDPVDMEKIREQIDLAQAIQDYNVRMEGIFKEYMSTFMDNTRKKIYLEKQGLPSGYITRRTREMSEKTFENIMEAYAELKQKVAI